MGMTPITIDDHTEVRVKDNVHTPVGWHLWMSIYVDGEYVTGDSGPVVSDLDDVTLERAARDWFRVFAS